MIKYSKQREAIREKIADRCDHPTADMIYTEIREDIPNISFATVYRNLNQLHEMGEVAKISIGGATRFDHRTKPHSHFYCRECGAVIDMPGYDSEISDFARESFEGSIESCSTNFYGTCPECLKKKKKQ